MSTNKNNLLFLSGAISLVVALAGCSASKFSSKTSTLSSTGGVITPVIVTSTAVKVAPWSLMNSEQIFKSMIHVTGQDGMITATQSAEFLARKGLLPNSDALTGVSAPMQMASTSLAGEVCNGLLAKEEAANATRTFFMNVNFAATPANNNKVDFDASVNAMANSFWGRAPTSEESALFSDFYTTFTDATGATQVDKTADLYLATCSAMLATVDTNTF